MISLDSPLEPCIENFIRESSSNDPNSSLNTIIIKVHRGVPMDRILLLLKEYFTNEDGNIRARATLLVSELVSRLPELEMSAELLHSLVLFLNFRLNDFPTLEASLKALFSILKNHESKMSSADVLMLLQTILKELNIQSFSQPLRKQCYELFHLILNTVKYTEFVTNSAMGGNEAESAEYMVIHGFLNAMEGEKDPRNLLLCLRCAASLPHKFKLLCSTTDSSKALVKQLFEVTSCYFPITFKPPPNDPYGITTENLISSLRSVFCSTPNLASLVIPMLLQKISADVVEAKIDSIETLRVCCNAYGVSPLIPYLNSIQSKLYQEVVHGSDFHIINLSLDCIASLSALVSTYSAITKRNDSWNMFIMALVSECTSVLVSSEAPDLMICRGAGRVLEAVGRESAKSYLYVLDSTVPILLEKLNSCTQNDKPNRSHVEAVILQILALINVIDKEIDQSVEHQPMRPHANTIFERLHAVFKLSYTKIHSKVKCNCLEGMTNLICSPPSPILAPEVVEQFVTELTSIIVAPFSQHDLTVKTQALHSLHSIAILHQYSSMIHTVTMPALLWEIEQYHSAENFGEGFDLKLVEFLIETLSTLCSERAFFMEFIPKLVQFSIDFLAKKAPTCIEISEKMIKKISLMVKSNKDVSECIDFCVFGSQSKEREQNSSITPANDSVVMMLLNALISRTKIQLNSSSLLSTNMEDSLVETFRLITQSASREAQFQLVKIFSGSFFNPSDADNIMSDEDNDNSGLCSFAPFNEGCPISQVQLIPLFAGVLSSIHMDIAIPNEMQTIKQLVMLGKYCSASTDKTSEHIERERAALSASQCLGSIINKKSQGQDLEKMLSFLLDEVLYPEVFTTVPNGNFTDNVQRIGSLRALLWICRGLLIRSHPRGKESLQKLLNFIVSEGKKSDQCTFAVDVANSFDTVLKESENVLTKSSGARISMLHKQRLYHMIFPTVIQNMKDQCNPRNLILVLAFLLSNTPKTILLPNLEEIVPLVVQGLKLNEKSVNVEVLKIVQIIYRDSLPIIKRHLHDVIPSLVAISRDGLTAKTRVRALGILQDLASLPFNELFPHKEFVLRELLVTLDDRKQAVRRRAVQVRNIWSVL